MLQMPEFEGQGGCKMNQKAWQLLELNIGNTSSSLLVNSAK